MKKPTMQITPEDLKKLQAYQKQGTAYLQTEVMKGDSLPELSESLNPRMKEIGPDLIEVKFFKTGVTYEAVLIFKEYKE